MKMQYAMLSKVDLLKGLNKALADYKIAALIQQGERSLYDYIKTSQDIVFDCRPTVLSPKKFFFPQEEVILEYTHDGKVAPKIEVTPLVLFGIRPCDLNGLKILDEAFADRHGDPNYLAKREKAVIIGMECKAECDEHAFCHKVNAHNISTGFDVMLYDLGDTFAVAIATDKGQKFTAQYFDAQPADASSVEGFLAEKRAYFQDKPPWAELEQLPDIFEENKQHPIWQQEADRCLSCGSCIMVCPTCYCFDVVDELALHLKKGERIRRWDACMLSPFAVVAGGENFRDTALARLKHRIHRKFNYLMRKHGQAVCVGCGRCVRACLAEISPKTIAEALLGDANE